MPPVVVFPLTALPAIVALAAEIPPPLASSPAVALPLTKLSINCTASTDEIPPPLAPWPSVLFLITELPIKSTSPPAKMPPPSANAPPVLFASTTLLTKVNVPAVNGSKADGRATKTPPPAALKPVVPLSVTTLSTNSSDPTDSNRIPPPLKVESLILVLLLLPAVRPPVTVKPTS